MEDITEFKDEIPLRIHGHIFPALQEDIDAMRGNSTQILNQLIVDRHQGVFTIQFIVGESAEPFNVIFGLTR